MIRRNFLKVLCASPLGFSVGKKETDLTLAQLEKCRDELTVLADNGIPAWTMGTSSNDSPIYIHTVNITREPKPVSRFREMPIGFYTIN